MSVNQREMCEGGVPALKQGGKRVAIPPWAEAHARATALKDEESSEEGNKAWRTTEALRRELGEPMGMVPKPMERLPTPEQPVKGSVGTKWSKKSKEVLGNIKEKFKMKKK